MSPIETKTAAPIQVALAPLLVDAAAEPSKIQSKTKTYFIQRISGGPVKIGISITPQSRLASLQTGCDEKLQIVALLDGDHEREVHERFAQARLAGEWFRDTTDLKRYIRQHGQVLVKDMPGHKRPVTLEPWRALGFRKVRVVDAKDVECGIPAVWPCELPVPDPADSCHKTKHLERAYEEENWRRIEALEKAVHNCECEACTVHHIQETFSWDFTHIAEVGCDRKRQFLWLTCRPIETYEDQESVFGWLPWIADELDILGWELYGLVTGPGIRPRVIDWLWFWLFGEGHAGVEIDLDVAGDSAREGG